LSAKGWRRARLVKYLAKVLVAAVLSVGLIVVSPAEAQAPKFTQAMRFKSLQPKAFAEMKVKQQWGKTSEFKCLDNLWTKESNWRSNALNKSSGAFGIAQFMPETWANYKYPYKPKDPQIQITAGLRYITKRYGTPCKAWAFWQVKRWY
jgi:hypothetical protein